MTFKLKPELIWKKVFAAGATVGSEMGTKLFCRRNREFCRANGRAVKEVRNVGRYHGGNPGPERPKELYSVK